MAKPKKETKRERDKRERAENKGTNFKPMINQPDNKKVRSGTDDTEHDPQGYNEGTKKRRLAEHRGKKGKSPWGVKDGTREGQRAVGAAGGGRMGPDVPDEDDEDGGMDTGGDAGSEARLGYRKKKIKEEAMGAAEYRKKGIYVTDSNHHGDPDEGQHSHDCERVHPNMSHKKWEILNSKTDGGPEGGYVAPRKKNYESVSNENTNVLKFIGSISKKNYAEANKYLQLALEDKLKRRIATIASKGKF